MKLSSIPEVDKSEAAIILRNGGFLIYPTESSYAIGGICHNPDVLKYIYQIKRRPFNKPLPLLAASYDQVKAIVHLAEPILELGRNFWPGPLTMLVSSRIGKLPFITNDQGKIAIRISSHPDAASLALQSGCPLVATSANISGRPPAYEKGEIDRDLINACNQVQASYGILKDTTRFTPNALPSTIVEPLYDGHKWVAKIIRSGSIPPCRISAYIRIIDSN